jgi:hypothetical protein
VHMWMPYVGVVWLWSDFDVTGVLDCNWYGTWMWCVCDAYIYVVVVCICMMYWCIYGCMWCWCL